MTPTFDRCFSRKKVAKLRALAPLTYKIMEDMAARRIRWPRRIEAMTKREIQQGRRIGKGHGLYMPPSKRIKLNAGMSAHALFLNFIHENLHHAFPKASDEHINRVLLPWVYYQLAGSEIPVRVACEGGI